jgi:hypothetical protein
MASVTASLPSAESDQDLLVRHAAGERAALDELFRRYRLPAYRVAFRLLVMRRTRWMPSRTRSSRR